MSLSRLLLLMPLARLFCIAPLALLAACAKPAQVRAPAPVTARAPAVASDANGVWDWVFRSTDDQGDLRVEQEEWHLSQRGSLIDGYYDRAVTMMSTDERLFRCNQRMGFTKVTRVRVAGRLEGERVRLREVSFEAQPGPCDDGARNLVEYFGVIRGSTLLLRWGPDAGQTLVRRLDGGHTPLAQAVTGAESRPMATTVSLDQSIPIDGTWEWELRSIDSEGDERLEREEWHLKETADGIQGFYDRIVKRVRGDGTFVCNGKERYETSTRYTVVGQRFGERVTLTEVDYKVESTKCDNALRRLDTYHGHLSDGDSLVLSWGPGNQLLRRKK